MRSNDPLARLEPKQIFVDAVWASDESATTKIFLLCIARFFDSDCRSSSMSYTQIANDCGFTESTSKRAAKAVRERWLRIEIGKGFFTPGKGRQNLYHGLVPEPVLDSLRQHKAAMRRRAVRVSPGSQSDTPTNRAGCKDVTPSCPPGYDDGTPKHEVGVTQCYPPGYHGDTLTLDRTLDDRLSESKETQNQITQAAAVERVAAAPIKLEKLHQKLLSAANGSIANPAVLNTAIPITWLEGGADLERDVLPTVRAVSARAHQQQRQINSWSYFTDAIAEAKRNREAGRAPFAAHTGGGQPSIDAVAESWLRSPHGKMAIDIHGGREEAKKFWIELQQEGKSDA